MVIFRGRQKAPGFWPESPGRERCHPPKQETWSGRAWSQAHVEVEVHVMSEWEQGQGSRAIASEHLNEDWARRAGEERWGKDKG